MKYKIQRAWRKEREIHHDTGSFPYPVYREIRAGLSWPNKGGPAYYCVVGQENYKNEFEKYLLVFLMEGESEDL